MLTICVSECKGMKFFFFAQVFSKKKCEIFVSAVINEGMRRCLCSASGGKNGSDSANKSHKRHDRDKVGGMEFDRIGRERELR